MGITGPGARQVASPDCDRHAARVRILGKYLLLQLPGWAAAAVVLWLLCRFLELPQWAAGVVFALYVAKDLFLYRYLRHSYSDAPSRLTGPELLVGQRGVVLERLAPSGWVRVRGERWRADARQGAAVEPGSAVVVRAVRGLTVEVEPESLQETPDT